MGPSVAQVIDPTQQEEERSATGERRKRKWEEKNMNDSSSYEHSTVKPHEREPGKYNH